MTYPFNKSPFKHKVSGELVMDESKTSPDKFELLAIHLLSTTSRIGNKEQTLRL